MSSRPVSAPVKRAAVAAPVSAVAAQHKPPTQKRTTKRATAKSDSAAPENTPRKKAAATGDKGGPAKSTRGWIFEGICTLKNVPGKDVKSVHKALKERLAVSAHTKNFGPYIQAISFPCLDSPGRAWVIWLDEDGASNQKQPNVCFGSYMLYMGQAYMYAGAVAVTLAPVDEDGCPDIDTTLAMDAIPEEDPNEDEEESADRLEQFFQPLRRDWRGYNNLRSV